MELCGYVLFSSVSMGTYDAQPETPDRNDRNDRCRRCLMQETCDLLVCSKDSSQRGTRVTSMTQQRGIVFRDEQITYAAS